MSARALKYQLRGFRFAAAGFQKGGADRYPFWFTTLHVQYHATQLYLVGWTLNPKPY